MFATIQGSAHATGLPDKSVHCIATSPPFWGLRRYAGDEEQEIDWSPVSYAPMFGLPEIDIPAMRCPLGNETDVNAYIGHLVLCAREWWRVLRDDGTIWLNIGDSYANDGKWGGMSGVKQAYLPLAVRKTVGREKRRTGLPPKSLVGVSWRLALALQADGWTLRSQITWLKTNGKPEAVKDRPTNVTEDIFLFAKSANYFYDAEAIKEPAQSWTGQAATFARSGPVAQHVLPGQTAAEHRPDRTPKGKGGKNAFRGQGHEREGEKGPANRPGRDFAAIGYGPTRNRRNVWPVATRGDTIAHFATWPPALVEPMIRAGTSARGVCGACGAPWVRAGDGWQPTCKCGGEETEPATVLDPFCGSGTTLMVAERLGRNSIGIDVAQKYLDELVPQRVANLQRELVFG